MPLDAWFHQATDWPDAVLPAYDGGSIANLPVSILRAFGVPVCVNPLVSPLDESILPRELLDNARVVVLVVVDGLSSAALERDAFCVDVIPPVIKRTITSVFPTTTAAALTSLQYGTSPGSHGMAGYTVFLPALGRVINLVRFKPVDGSSIDSKRLDPRAMVATPSIFDRLRDVGVDSVVVSHQEYERSPLTLAQSGDTEYLGHRTLAEMAARLSDAVRRPGRRFVFGYWAGVDMLSHTWGPASDAARLDFRLFQRALVDGVLIPLRDRGEDAVVIVTADHGHTTVDPERQISLADLARVVGGWAGPPTGERRAVGLTVPTGSRAMLASAVSGRGAVVPVADAMLHGLFGPPPHHPELISRIGDLLLLARANASFPYRVHGENKPPALGAHGSLTADEMLVPMLVWRFGR